MMTHNVGGMDRDVRLLGGGFLVAMGIFSDLGAGWRIGAAALGVMELTTAFSRYCPVNQAMGINTADPKEALESQAENAAEEAGNFAVDTTRSLAE
jgi:hypothetical protein